MALLLELNFVQCWGIRVGWSAEYFTGCVCSRVYLFLSVLVLTWQVMVERQLEREGEEDKEVASFAETAFSLHLRLSVLLHDAVSVDADKQHTV